MLNLDTHIFIRALNDDLSRREKALMRSQTCRISSIVLWEFEMLSTQGRIDIGLDTPEVIEALEELTVWDISREVCVAVRRLDFRADPADSLIAATSVVHRAPLLTRDARIMNSRVVPIAR